MVYPCAHALIHKHYVAANHHTLKQLIGVAQQHRVVVAQKLLHLIANHSKQPKQIEIIRHVLKQMFVS